MLKEASAFPSGIDDGLIILGGTRAIDCLSAFVAANDNPRLGNRNCKKSNDPRAGTKGIDVVTENGQNRTMNP